jgi:hypothetical protein
MAKKYTLVENMPGPGPDCPFSWGLAEEFFEDEVFLKAKRLGASRKKRAHIIIPRLLNRNILGGWSRLLG